MGQLRQLIADLVYSDSDQNRIDSEVKLVSIIRGVARQEGDKPVEVLDTLPAEAPAGHLMRETATGNLYLGNGAGRPLSKFMPAP